MNPTLRKIFSRVLLCGLGALCASSSAAAPAHDARGFLYGRITTTSGSVYEGRLRWNDKEEAFWGDFFNAGKEDMPYREHIPQKERRRESIEIFGVRIGIGWSEDEGGRQLGVRFGDIRRIEIKRGNEATVVLKSGARYDVRGGSNDVDSETLITVWDRASGERRLQWNKIRRIEFLPAPANLTVPAFRLRGTVHSEGGIFRGYIQWDQDECLSSDELDGRTSDGEVSLKMGEIRSIERQGRDSSKVVMRNGRAFVLQGTNDVDASNRGIYVSDSRFGRVLVNWDAFRRLDFDPPGDSGPAYTDFRPGRPLFGKVSTAQGRTYRGRIVYDVDETEMMDLLDGKRQGVEYSIPFARIAFLLPEKSGSSRVVLRNGQEMRLEDTADVGPENAGVLVFEQGQAKPRYIPWEDVRRVDFEDR